MTFLNKIWNAERQSGRKIWYSIGPAIFLIFSLSFLIVSAVFVKHNYNESTINKEIKKLVIDTDAGGDDAVAILLMLAADAAHDDFKIVAITCTYGNTAIENVERNVLKTLTIANRSDIPVYSGMEKPLITRYVTDEYFGKDGFGDFTFEQQITAKIDNSKHASIALVEIAKKYSGELNVLTLGPLTNIAMAVKLDPSFVKNVKHFYSMGGSVHGIGNRSPNVEFNFGTDPESNFILFHSVVRKSSIVLTPWEVIINANISMNWRIQNFGLQKSTFVQFLNKAESTSLAKNGNLWKPADAIAAAAMLWPDSLITKFVTAYVQPVIDGMAKGSLLVDYTNKTGKLQNVKIIDAFNTNEFLQILLKYLT